MKYVVEVCYGNSNEWSDEEELYGEALNYALAMSELAGVSEARVWAGDVIVATCVDGMFQVDEHDDEEEDDWAEYDEPNYPYDEWGYDPYAGGFDPDL